MSRVAYVNGRYVPHRRRRPSPIEDRGFQFADGVYEVWAVMGGHGWPTPTGTSTRLERSLGELRIALPMARAALLQVVARDRAAQPGARRGSPIIQVTRGDRAARPRVFRRRARPPTLVVTAKTDRPRGRGDAKAASRASRLSPCRKAAGRRCDIKTVGLLPNVLAKQAAREAGAYEAWFVDRGRPT